MSIPPFFKQIGKVPLWAFCRFAGISWQKDGDVCMPAVSSPGFPSIFHNLLLVLHTPRLHAGLLPRIPPVGYTDRSNPFSPNAPCSPDPRTISLYNKPIIHKSIRGLGSIPSKVLPLTQHSPSVLPCGFSVAISRQHIEVCGRFAAVS